MSTKIQMAPNLKYRLKPGPGLAENAVRAVALVSYF